jgi:hypothetical protein
MLPFCMSDLGHSEEDQVVAIPEIVRVTNGEPTNRKFQATGCDGRIDGAVDHAGISPESQG